MSDSSTPRIARSPLPEVARLPLHLILLLDCSGSMAVDGKVQALNTAVREVLPHLVDATLENPHAEVLLRAVRFSSDASWHVRTPTPVEQVRWVDVEVGGYTDLGRAIDLITPELSSPPMPPHALPPAIVLVSDGRPTDDFDASLERLLETEWGAQSIRAAIAIGRDADLATLSRFMGDGVVPLSARNPEQLTRALKWATVRAATRASQLSTRIDVVPPALRPEVAAPDVADRMW